MLLRTGSTAQRASRVPTAQLASKGVKLKYGLGEIITTSGGAILTCYSFLSKEK